jgi:hypothetical protein
VIIAGLDNISFYVNGELVPSSWGTGTGSAMTYSSSYSGVLGSCPDSQWLSGILDDIGMWNRVLDEEEIHNIYLGCTLSITQQPLSYSAPLGEEANFSLSNLGTAGYQWQTNLGFGWQNVSDAGQYSGTNTAILTVSNVDLDNENQLFRCILESNNCDLISDEVTLNVIPTSVIEEYPNEFLIYPNPSSGSIKVIVPIGSLDGTHTLNVMDALGRIIETVSINNSTETIDLRSLGGSGVYSIWVRNDQRDVWVNRLILVD